MKAFILTYHSHHVLGAGYDVNDHVAFPADLELITALGYRIVELGELVQEATRRGLWRSIATRGLAPLLVVIEAAQHTIDDVAGVPAASQETHLLAAALGV